MATSKTIITIEIMFDETSIRNNGVAVDSLSARKRILSIHYPYIILLVSPDLILNINMFHFKILLDVIFAKQLGPVNGTVLLLLLTNHY